MNGNRLIDARELAEKGNFFDAIAIYNLLINQVAHATLFFERGFCFYKLGKHETAISDYDLAIKLDNKNSLFFYNRGVSKLQLHLFQEAISDFQSAIALDDCNSDYYQSLGYSFSKIGKYNESISNYSRAIELNGTDINLFFDRGSVNKLMREYESAIVDFSKAIEMNQAEERNYHLQTEFNPMKLIEIKEYNERLYYERANCYFKQAEYSMVTMDFFNLVDRKTFLKDEETNSLQNAISDFTASIKINPKSARYFFGRGNCYYYLMEFVKVIEDYSKAIELKPNEKLFYQERAKVYKEMGKLNESNSDLEFAKSLVEK